MTVRNVFRRLRGAFGNALAWGLAWSASVMAFFAVLKVFGTLDSDETWQNAFKVAGQFGIIVALAGNKGS